MEKKPSVLILLSGGLDSTATLNFYLESKYEVKALLIDYGQISFRNEKIAVKRICEYYGVKYKIISIYGLPMFKSGLIIGRNSLLFMTALTYSGLKNQFIASGIHYGTNYPDCSEIFVTEIQKLFDLYTNGQIQIGVPFIKWNKSDIWEYCKKREIPTDLTYSCELGLEQPCGICLSCKDIMRLNESENK